jgi:hypothetical protein
MDQVPKVIANVVQDWSNDGYIVSFKVRVFLSSHLFKRSDTCP